MVWAKGILRVDTPTVWDGKRESCEYSLGARMQAQQVSHQGGGCSRPQVVSGRTALSIHQTRPDIAFAVSNIARYCGTPKETHWKAVKRILRYLRGTSSLGLKYTRQESGLLCLGYADADWAGSVDDRKSTSGYVFQTSGAAVSWRRSKQSCVALSTAEAEYVALAGASQEAVWLNGLAGELCGIAMPPVTLMEDNQSAIAIAHNPQFHGKTKHVDIKYHYVRSQVESGNICLRYCPTEDMVADVLTKSLPAPLFTRLRRALGICDRDELEKQQQSLRRSVGDLASSVVASPDL